ncbi:MAG: sigma-70 family RNA polymerase sigma factor [Steroidobacteraceae bacterium]
MNVRSESVVPAEDKPLSVASLISKYHRSLIGVLRRRVRASEDAADVAQEAYLRMMQYEGSREIQSPYSMLVRIAINVANDLARAEKVRHVRQHGSIDDIELMASTATPEQQLSAQQDLDQLTDAIADLPPRCQQVFLLSRYEHMTYQQIAEHCGISVKMVEKHISNALAFCMARVGEARGDPS